MRQLQLLIMQLSIMAQQSKRVENDYVGLLCAEEVDFLIRPTLHVDSI